MKYVRPFFLTVAFFLSAQGAAQDLPPVRFEVRWELRASANAFESNKTEVVGPTEFANFVPLSRVDVSASSMGQEVQREGRCGTVERQSRAEARASGQIQVVPQGFALVIASDLRAQGGFFTMSQAVSSAIPFSGATMCFRTGSQPTPASAEALAQAEVQISLGEEGRDYWLDLVFESQSSGGTRSIRLRAPDGTELEPVSGEPILLRYVSGSPYILRIHHLNNFSEVGRCCGKEDKATLRVSGSVRPLTTLLEKGRAQGRHDATNEFAGVGLLVTRDIKGQPVPFCVASAVGPRTLVTAAHCLSPSAIRPPDSGGKIYFIPGPNFEQGRSRAREVIRWEAPFEYVDLKRLPANSDPVTQSVTDVAVAYVDADLATSVKLGPEEPITGGSNATLVNFTPPPGVPLVEYSTIGGWIRGVVPVTVQGDMNDVLTVMTASGGCGTASGSPVFARGIEGSYLAAIMVSNDKDCSLKAGPKLDRHLSWIRERVK